MIHIFLRVFILAFSLVFCGCPVCQVKNTILKEKLNELCSIDLKWLLKSYEERIEYSLRPFLDDIKEELEEAEKLCKKASDFVDSVKRFTTSEEIEKNINAFLKENNLDPGIEKKDNIMRGKPKIDKKKEVKEKVQEILKDLKKAYQENSELEEHKKKINNEEAKKKSINNIAFSIYIAKKKLNKKKNEEQEFIQELKNLYKSEKGKVAGFAKAQRGELMKKDDSKSYDIDELYKEFKNFYECENIKAPTEEEVERVLEDVVKKVQDFYAKKKEDKEQKMKQMFLEEVEKISIDILRTFSLFTGNKDCEFIKILIGTLLFTVFCIRYIELNEGGIPRPTEDDIKRELSGMQDFTEKKKNKLLESIVNESDHSLAYAQGINFFAGFFIDLCLFNKQKIAVNVENKWEIESKIIKLFVFYLLRKWECDSFVNYFSSCSLYDIRTIPSVSQFIYSRRFKLLHGKNFESASEIFYARLVHPPLVSYSIFKHGDNNYLNYILDLKLNLYIVKKKEVNFYFDWFSFLYYKLLHIWEKDAPCDENCNLKYYCEGPYAEMIKVLFSSNKCFSKKQIMEDFFPKKNFLM